MYTYKHTYISGDTSKYLCKNRKMELKEVGGRSCGSPQRTPATHIRVLAHVLTASLLIHLPVNESWDAENNAKYLCSCVPSWRTR